MFRDVSGLSGTNVATFIENGDQPHRIATQTTNTYTITLTLGLADGNNSSAGQASGYYYLETGIADAVLGPGWGAGTWGRGTWGSEIDDIVGEQIRLWSIDSFGEDIIVNLFDGDLYYYHGDATAERLVPLREFGLSTLAQNAVPSISRFVAVSDVDRHVLCFGVTPNGSTLQDKLLIRWSSREDPFDWNPTTSNTAGDLRISQGTEITGIAQTRKEILVWTDQSLHTVQYQGTPYYFGQALIAESVNIASPNASAAVNDLIFWMGYDNFYRYDGRVQVMPCTVKRYVFDDINRSQLAKIYCSTMTKESEVWWFYPSSLSDENDRYIIFNYQENAWYYGTLSRTAMIDASSTIRTNPQATGGTGNSFLYNQERGLDDGEQSPAIPIDAFVESSDFDLGEGDRFMLTQRIIPDITFTGSITDSGNPAVNFKIKVRDYPGVSYSDEPSDTTTRTSTTPVEQFTKQAFVRARGRSAALRIESDRLGTMWQLGYPRLELRQDGRK